MKKIKFLYIALVLLVCIPAFIPDASLSAAIPAVPDQFRVEIKNNYAEISWAAVSSDVNYTTIEKSTDSGDFYTIATIYKGTTSYKDYGISNGHVYRYRARNVSSSTSGSYTGEMEVIYLYPNYLGFKNTYSDQINLVWSYPALKIDRIISYETVIERRMDGESEWKLIHTASFGELEYSDTGLLPNTIYYYRIRTKHRDGSYSYYYPGGSWIYSRTSIPLTTPVSGFALSESQIRLEWDASALSGYTLILQKMDSTGAFNTIYTTKTASHYTDSGLTKGVTYSYRIYLMSDNGKISPYSDVAGIMTETIPAPGNCKASPSSSGKIVISWDYPYSVESGFEVWRKEDGAIWQKLDSLPKNTTIWTDHSAQLGHKYTYRVRAIRSTDVFSSFSTSALINNADPADPPKLVLINLDGHMLIGSDNAPPAGIKYVIEYRTGINEIWQDYYSAEGEPLRFYFFPSPNQEYDLRLRAENKGNIAYGPIYHLFGSTPQAPQGLKAEAVGSNRVFLSWSDITEKEDYYNLYRVTNGKTELIKRLPKNSTSYSDTGVTPGTSVRYELKAYNILGESAAAAVNAGIPKKASYKDISGIAWAGEAIDYLTGIGAISQGSDPMFYPDRMLTRAEFLSMLYKATDSVPMNNFLFSLADVPKNEWYHPYVMTAAKTGVLIPDTSNRAEPMKSLSNADAAIFLSNYLANKNQPLNRYGTDVLSRYNDSYLIEKDLEGVIASLVGDSILPARPDTGLNYGKPLTRAEGAVILFRFIKKYKL